MSKLAQELNYNVIFSSKNIIFRDRKIEKMIGESVPKNKLYILKYQEIKCALVKGNNHELWHKRLGHPPDRVLSRFLDYPLKTYTNYDIYKMSKQSRLSFSLSKSKIKKFI
jgi:hypothetical protein